MAVALSGSIVLEGSITGSLLGTSSYSSNAGLLNGLDSSVFALTSSLGSFTSSLNDFSSSINTYTASNNDNIAAINAATASLYSATASLYLTTASLNQYTASLNTRSASFACIDSTNNFGCVQYFSNASNAVSFTSTGSLYSDGGMRLTKDLYVSGTSYFNNVTVFGTQSVNYITSSQLDISDNIITVNTATPTVRYGGLAVYDSGSLGTGLTGSILWDSEANHWVYSNPSGSSYSGGMFISGPRTATLGSEQGTTSCMLLAGQGGDHLTSSAIYHSSTVTCVPNTLVGSTICSTMANASCIGIGTTTPATPLQIVTTSLPAIQLTLGSEARCHNITGVNLGRDLQVLPFRHFSVQTGNGITEGQIVLNAYEDFIVGTGASYTSRLTITGAGAACFACNVTATTQGLNSDFNAGAFIARGSGSTTKYTQVGFDSTSNYGWVQALEQGVAYRNLILNGAGGNVGIGCTTPGQSLTVQSAGVATYLKSTATSDSATYGNFQMYRQACKVGNGVGFALGLINSAAIDTEYAYIGTLIESCTSTQECGAIGFYTTTAGNGRCERLRINSNGNVSIGIVTSAYPLSVHKAGPNVFGTVYNIAAFTDGSAAFKGINLGYINNEQTGVIYAETAACKSNIAFWTYDGSWSERVRIACNGNVGIGTTSPTTKLEVIGDTSNVNGYSDGTIQVTGLSPIAFVGPSNLNPSLNRWGFTLREVTDGDFSIRNYRQSTTPLIIKDSGNVGIGTISPKTYAVLTTSGMITAIGSVGVAIGESFRINNYYNSGTGTDRTISTGYASSIGLDNANGGMTFNMSSTSVTTDNNIAVSERMRISSGGSVGINTNAPNSSSPLHVKMCSNSNGDGIRIQAVCSGAGGSQPGIAFASVADSKRYSISLDNSGDLLQVTNCAGLNVLQIFQCGITYINTTTNPLSNATGQFSMIADTGTDAMNIKHLANGNNSINIWQTGATTHSALAFYKGDAQNVQGTISVTTSAVTYNSTSDYRLKENVVPLENGLGRLMQIKPSKFNWIETGEEAEGFIAHELQEIYPGAVTGEKDAVYNSTGNIKPQSVDYGRITPLLVKAIQEQQCTINTLKTCLGII